MKPILIITAVPQEIRLLESLLQQPQLHTTAPLPYRTGTIAGGPVVLAVGGIGKVNAALATTLLIERCAPGLVINTGCAGAYPGSGLCVGDLALADEEFMGDEGVITGSGWMGFKEIGFPVLSCAGRAYHNRLPLSETWVERALELAATGGVALKKGPFVTVSTCSGTLLRGVELEQRFGALTENMEGAAVAQVCLRYGVDCLEIRGISNMVDERNMESWDIPQAVEAAQRFVAAFLESLSPPAE